MADRESAGVPGEGMPDEAVLRAVFGDRTGAAHRYADMLVSRGVEWGLIGPREIDRIWERHLLNSAAVAPLIGAGLSVVDIGSGAGLPGIPIALARPDLRVTLLEPLERRHEFLTLAVAELGLTDRVTCRRGRAEDVRGDRWDVVTGRAVAPLPRLLDWTLPLVVPGGTVLAIKGASAQAEVDKAAALLRRIGWSAEVLVVRAHPETEPTWTVRVVKSM